LSSGSIILVAESDKATQNQLADALKGAGYRVIQAPDGLQAITKVDAQKPDLVIAEAILPELDGMRLLKALKSRPETRAIPVILLTAKADPSAMIEGIAAGARFYVVKPFQMEDLLSKVKRALKGKD
jgi:DNA-binding response OmpR family regulator